LERVCPTPYCAACKAYLVEALCRGTCRSCNAKTYADACEACGMPNFGVSLEEVHCSVCGGKPDERPVRRLLFPLEPHRPAIEAFLRRATMGGRARALAEKVLAGALPDVPVTIPADWGIDVPVAGYENQRISPWFEVAASFLSNTSELLRRLEGEGDWRNVWCGERRAHVIQLFGFDNGFFYLIFYPALLAAFDSSIGLPAT